MQDELPTRSTEQQTYRHSGPCARHKIDGCVACDEQVEIPRDLTADSPTLPAATTSGSGGFCV